MCGRRRRHLEPGCKFTPCRNAAVMRTRRLTHDGQSRAHRIATDRHKSVAHYSTMDGRTRRPEDECAVAFIVISKRIFHACTCTLGHTTTTSNDTGAQSRRQCDGYDCRTQSILYCVMIGIRNRTTDAIRSTRTDRLTQAFSMHFECVHA